MKSRNHVSEPASATPPVCWQREVSAPCLRLELTSGEMHLLSYQHFIAASFKRLQDGNESVELTFSTHEAEMIGRGLKELLLDLQDLSVKWVRTAPAQTLDLAFSSGFVSQIRLTKIE